MIKLYSTGCPQCRMLEARLKSKGYEFEIVSDENEIRDAAVQGKMTQIPFCYVDGVYKTFLEVLAYVK